MKNLSLVIVALAVWLVSFIGLALEEAVRFVIRRPYRGGNEYPLY